MIEIPNRADIVQGLAKGHEMALRDANDRIATLLKKATELPIRLEGTEFAPTKQVANALVERLKAKGWTVRTEAPHQIDGGGLVYFIS